MALGLTATTQAQQPGTGTGSFASPPAFSSGSPQLAQVVFTGGTVAQLDAAMRSVGATGAWAQTSTGAFVLYIVGGPAFVNAPFNNAFPSGFATVTALTLVRISNCSRYSFSVGDPVGTPALPPFVCIDMPRTGDHLVGTVTVSGYSGGAFEQALVIEARNASGGVIAQRPVTVTAPDIGQVGPYSATLTIPAGTTGPGRIVVFATSPRDGSVMFSDEVSVHFGP